MSSAKDADGPEWYQKEFLYAVLNLPVYATQSEIKERHRALSLIYHPDKLRNADESTRETAKRRFLEVQKAYEVLSDPFLREVYNTLGYEGLYIKLPPSIRSIPLDELPAELYHISANLYTAQLESRVRARGRIVVGLDVRELFAGGWIWREWYRDALERVGMCGLSAFSVRHSFEKELGSQTKLALHGAMSHNVGDDTEDAPGTQLSKASNLRVRGNIVANLTHRHSSKFSIEASAPLLRRHRLTLTPTYSDGTNHLSLSTSFFPNPYLLYPFPPTNLSFSRRLFRTSLHLGTIALQLNPLLPPALSISLTKPCVPFDVPQSSGEEGDSSSGPSSPRRASKRSSVSPYLPLIPLGYNLALNLRTFAPGPSINYELLVLHSATNLRAKVGFDLGVTGLMSTLTGEWNNDEGTTGVSCTVGLGGSGVVARVSINHLGQNIIFPLVLSTFPHPQIALFATALPVSCYAILDYFYLRQKRVQKRIRRRNARKQAHDEFIQAKKREAEETALLLRENARRHVQSEKNSDGLIIHEATYLPLDESYEPIRELGVDVTVVLQSLVNNGQLFIPGNRPKSSLRGFFDPLPEFPKRLCIRYEFGGRMHYVEVKDWVSVVLPLEDHLVEDTSRT